jgi:hypothetical protein
MPLPDSFTFSINRWKFLLKVVPSANALTAFNVISPAPALTKKAEPVIRNNMRTALKNAFMILLLSGYLAKV